MKWFIVPVCAAEALRVTILPVHSERNRLVYDMHAWRGCYADQWGKAASLLDALGGSKERVSSILVDEERNRTCTELCHATVNSLDVRRYLWAIESEYNVELKVGDVLATNADLVTKGFQLGYRVGNDYYINNHLILRVQFEKTSSDHAQVKQVIVEAQSRENLCGIGGGLRITPSSTSISFSYEVTWEEYHKSHALGIFSNFRENHHFVNASISAILVVLAIASVLIWLKREISLSSDHADSWRSLHTEVFRKPAYPRLLAGLVGVGVGLAFSTLLVGGGATLGLVNHETAAEYIVPVSLIGSTVAGYFSSFTYLYMGGKRWQEVATVSSVIIPVCLIYLLVIQRIFSWYSAKTLSSDSFIQLSAEASLITVGVVVLVFIGGKLASGASRPTTTEGLAKKIPRQPWFMQSWIWSLCSGLTAHMLLLPLLCLVPGSYILQCIWKRHLQSIGGVVIVSFLTTVSSCLLSLITTYSQLRYRDYKWHWRSFAVGASPAFWLLFQSVYYYFDQLDRTNHVAAVAYFGYMALISASMALLTGSLGCLASFRLVSIMYLANKID